nr:immunoglobulin light chain junction region [Macaca mulatta]MOX81499.1 immunoglobulin light chain junction region [Macaca mulatta]MOX83445.1 immunoglobulin light chain junction region [Macaca mulatta]MOX84430.1 immunoglobulin light chain junction region [Macaca mulatta]
DYHCASYAGSNTYIF